MSFFLFLILAEMSKLHQLLPIKDFLSPVKETKQLQESISDPHEPFNAEYPSFTRNEFEVLFQPWDSPVLLDSQDFNALLQTNCDPENVHGDRDLDQKGSSAIEIDCKVSKKNDAKVSTQQKVKLLKKNANKRHSCGTCGQGFIAKHTLLIHRHLEHLGFSFVCPIDPGSCFKQFKSKNGLRYHVDREHSAQFDDFTSGKYREIVAKTEQISENEFKQGPLFFIKKNEIGSPRLVKCKTNIENSCGSSSQDESSSSNEVSERSKSTVENQNNGERYERQTRSKGKSNDNRHADIENSQGFEEKFKKMYNEFSPALKKSANAFNFMRNVATDGANRVKVVLVVIVLKRAKPKN